MDKIFRNYGFIKKDNDWYNRGFLFIKIIGSQIEVKVMNEQSKPEFFYIKDMPLIMSYYKSFVN